MVTMFLRILVTCLVIDVHVLYSHIYDKKTENKEDWIDPHDMLYFDSNSKEMKMSKKSPEEDDLSLDCKQFNKTIMNRMEKIKLGLNTCEKTNDDISKKLEKCIEQLDLKAPSEIPFLQQYIVSLLDKMPDADSQLIDKQYIGYSMNVELSQETLETLRTFADKKSGNLQDAHFALVDMIKEVTLHKEYEQDTWKSWINDFLFLHLVTAVKLSAAFALCCIGVFALSKVRISWTALSVKLLSMLFLISVPWNWWLLYKQKVAKRHAEMLKNMPSECSPREQTMMQVVVSWFSVNVDKCAKYHEQIMVDPMWDVAPTTAIAVTITKFFVEPLQHIGEALGKFIRAPLQELPVHLWPIALTFVIAVFFLVAIMACGYRIKFFHFFGIEPVRNTSGVEDLHRQIQTLSNKVDTITQTPVANALVEKSGRQSLIESQSNNSHFATENIGANWDYADSLTEANRGFLPNKRLAIEPGGLQRSYSLEDLRSKITKPVLELKCQQNHLVNSKAIKESQSEFILTKQDSIIQPVLNERQDTSCANNQFHNSKKKAVPVSGSDNQKNKIQIYSEVENNTNYENSIERISGVNYISSISSATSSPAESQNSKQTTVENDCKQVVEDSDSEESEEKYLNDIDIANMASLKEHPQ